MNPYRHVIWDWNGTLLDGVHLCVEIINGMLRERDLPAIDAATYQEVFGFPIKGYYEALGFDFTKEPFEELATQYCEVYHARVAECALHADAREVLGRVGEQGMSQSMLSSHEHWSLISILEHHELLDHFQEVSGLEDRRAAGKVELGKELMQRLDIDPSRTVLVGDTLHDYEVASVLGTSCILLDHGHHSRRRLEKVHDQVVESLEALEKVW